jgi:hypothetical protein
MGEYGDAVLDGQPIVHPQPGEQGRLFRPVGDVGNATAYRVDPEQNDHRRGRRGNYGFVGSRSLEGATVSSIGFDEEMVDG